MKRIALFLATNLAVLLVFSVVWMVLSTFFGLSTFAGGKVNYTGRLVFCAIFGFGGAFVSLLMSKWMAKRSTGARVIERPANPTEQWLVDTVARLAQRAGIGMPEVAVYDGDPNAFATGAFKNEALVAVSTGLLVNMTREEVEAVLGHEVAHIANGDMVTMTLIQGVTNTFVVFLSRVVGFVVDRALSRNDESTGGAAYMVTVIVCQIAFGILASLIVAWFSRQREFRADSGSAQLLGARQPMINALYRLGSLHDSALPQNVATLGIRHSGGFFELFSSHPPIEQRVAALQQG